MNALQLIGWQFDRNVWNRGVEIHFVDAIDRVRYERDSATWHARVRSTAGRLHQVWMCFDDDDDDETDGDRLVIDGDCDCREPKPCKHLAAVAIRVLERLDQPDADDNDEDELDARPIAASPAALERWAIASARAQRPARTPTDARRPKHLRFVVQLVTESLLVEPRTRVVITTWQVVQRKRSAPQMTRCVIDSPVLERRGALDWVDDDDLATWMLLRRAGRSEVAAGHYTGSTAMVPFDTTGTELLARLVATGRCHLDSPTGVALRTGEPRRGQAVWELDEHGRQLLQIHLADPDDERDFTLLPLVPLHYIEIATGLCGSIDLGVPAAMHPWLTIVPAVEPAWSSALPPVVAAALDRASVPRPRALEVPKPRRVAPKPVLRLQAQHDGMGGKRPRATLAFDYAGIEVEPADHREALVRIDGDRVERIERDDDAEANARRELARHGLFGDPSALTLPDEGAWYELARVDVPSLQAAGWQVAIDDDFEWTALHVDEWYANAKDDEADHEAWFLDLGVVVGGERINILPAIVAAIRTGTITRERLAVSDKSLVVALPDGRRVELDRARVQTMLDVLVELHGEHALHEGGLRLVRLDAARVHELPGFTWDITPRLRTLADRLRTGPSTEVQPPTGLTATLREYQLRGVQWLQWLREGELGGILADDMGLGKTLQALAHVLVDKHAGRLTHPVLVVAPRSVLRNWQREAERFTPELRAAIYHGPFRHAITAAIDKWDVIITTYALLQRDEALVQTRWHMVLLDEAQAIKNPAAKVSLAARALVANQRICMTGTPMENNLGDLWSLMAFVNPGLLGTSRQFTSWYRTPIEKHGEVGRFDALCRRIAPFLLRRTKAQVLAELPPKTEVVLHAELDGPQRDLYESVRLTMEKKVREQLARRGLARSNIIVLDALLKLRQVCCDPQLVKLAQAKAVGTSAKLDLLMELVDELVREGRRALVFSQFTSMLALIERELNAREIPWMSITGRTIDRQAVVDRFQAGLAPILLVSLKAGGTGLNLTAADTVIHYDPWWNPAVEAQATDRAHRLGQRQPITVYRLICEGTVEERILALQAKKSALMRGVHDSAERRASAAFALDEQDIAALLAPIGEPS